MKLLITFLIFTLSLSTQALPIDSLTMEKVKKGVYYMENEQYEKAGVTFGELMKPGIVLPDEICYYMGNTLYHTGRTRNSLRFLWKYLDLTDTVGVYYHETIALLESMGEGNPNEKVDDIEDEAFISVQDDPCQGKEHVVCPICSGTGVIIKQSKFGTVYKTCAYSDEHGVMDCARYKKYLDGELIEYDPSHTVEE